jgi:hypothetical protein
VDTYETLMNIRATLEEAVANRGDAEVTGGGFDMTTQVMDFSFDLTEGGRPGVSYWVEIKEVQDV